MSRWVRCRKCGCVLALVASNEVALWHLRHHYRDRHGRWYRRHLERSR